MLCLPGTISRSPLGTLSTEVARADAKHENMQQFSRRPLQHGRSRLHSKNKKLALRDVNSFASSAVPKQGLNGDGAVVSYLENKGDNHETYDNSISLCVRALQHGRACKHGSS
jgi:ABC-type phosphate/phosphonate transport system substrate-binding protein